MNKVKITVESRGKKAEDFDKELARYRSIFYNEKPVEILGVNYIVTATNMNCVGYGPISLTLELDEMLTLGDTKMPQETLMKFDPAHGEPEPYPSHASQYRAYHGSVAWLFNPWTGDARSAQDIGTDCFGYAIVDVKP